jgi:flagellar hook-basal body complex protein FliE
MSVNRLDNRSDINSLLQQMRQLKAQAQVDGQLSPFANRNIQALDKSDAVNILDSVQKSDATGFTQLLKQAINSVNETQQTANDMRTSYELGDSKVSLNQVMVASQKATVSFEAMTQVRNRLVEAYQDIMNMPI